MSTRSSVVATRPPARDDAHPASAVADSTADSKRTLEVSDDVVDAVAAEIHRVSRQVMMEFVDSVGRLVLDRFYAGSMERWRNHGAKDTSLRRLAERLSDDVGLGTTGLWRCVAIHCFLKSNAGIRELNSVTPTHLRTVLPLPEGERVELLKRAAAERWSVVDLASQVQRRLGRVPRTTGRPPMPEFAREINRLAALVLRGGLFRDLHLVSEVDPEVLERLYRTLMRVRERLDRLQPKISPKKGKNRGEPSAPGAAEAHA